MVSMLTTLVLRQEVQMNIYKQDTAFVLFVGSQGPGNLAQSLYGIGETWRQTKEHKPEQVKAPMRVIMFQHVLETVATKFQEMMATPSSRSTAQHMGFLLQDGVSIPALKWDPTTKQLIRDDKVEPLNVTEIKEALQNLLVLSSKDRVINRFHGMRKLSEEYKAPSLGMFLEIGVRTAEASEAWQLLHRFQQSAAWQAASLFMRHERMTMSALAKRLAALTRGQ
ncbi:eff [Symbiodinium necroappetens]|uniref:Eff protein n=1 Tax=Symbiodinium necroappetens TaxID=1628268 RepID=A0A813CKQ4_9DINO|nr:eff [Symbiodinium necroappetens]